MNLRNLVPALALAAVTAAPAVAADPTVSFNGWVDTILTFADDDSDDDAATGKDEAAGTLRFTSDASLKANWKVTDALTAKVNLWFDADFADVQAREAYFAWAINDTVTWSMGKYICHIGWISAEPTGLYTINASLIGYTAAYGNDVLGTSIAVAPKDSPISGSFHIVNGYYTGSDAVNGGLSDARENTDLGFGLDLIYALPDKLGSINLELAYDMSSGEGDPDGAGPEVADYLGNAPAGGIGGEVFLVGLNATVTPAKGLTLVGEVQMWSQGEAEDATGADAGGDADRLQGLLLANYVIEGAAIPMSVTGMVQYVTIDNNAAEDETRLGGAVALLTNPLSSTNFGLNFELGFFDIADEGGVAGEDNNGINVAVEGLVTF